MVLISLSGNLTGKQFAVVDVLCPRCHSIIIVGFPDVEFYGDGDLSCDCPRCAIEVPVRIHGETNPFSRQEGN